MRSAACGGLYTCCQAPCARSHMQCLLLSAERLLCDIRDALLAPGSGAAWLAHAPQQANVALVAARGMALPREPRQAARQLAGAAEHIGAAAGFRFGAGERAARHLHVVM